MTRTCVDCGRPDRVLDFDSRCEECHRDKQARDAMFTVVWAPVFSPNGFDSGGSDSGLGSLPDIGGSSDPSPGFDGFGGGDFGGGGAGRDF